MSAMASAGLTRVKIFEMAARAESDSSVYFRAVNMLVEEFRFDYPEACRRVGLKAKSDNMRSFLLRLSDALRSGEPMSEFLSREAEAQSEEYESRYERDLESLKQWTNAFSSITISVALIIIVQVISSMIYSMNSAVMGGLVLTGIMMSAMSTWIIYRSAPREQMVMPARQGSQEQKRAVKRLKLLGPIAGASAALMFVLGVELGYVLIWVAVLLVPVGWASMMSDKSRRKKDEEFATFLRSSGGMASSSGTTLNQALNRLDLSSFPHLQADIERLSKRLNARIDPIRAWHQFGMETGSKLISSVADIFYGAIQLGGDPERVGYLCSLFAAKTSQLRARRKLTAGTFSGLITVMQAAVAGLMVFVLAIVTNFADLVSTLMPAEDAAAGQQQMSLGMAEFSASDIQFLSTLTVSMVLMLALVSAAAIIFSDGGFKLKVAFYIALTVFISGLCLLIVPPMVTNIVKI
ncbi:MAG: type II secretion system F family protein [Chloroflexota bacterium]